MEHPIYTDREASYLGMGNCREDARRAAAFPIMS